MVRAAVSVASSRPTASLKRSGLSVLTVPLLLTSLVYAGGFSLNLLSPPAAQAANELSKQADSIDVALVIEPSKADAALWGLANLALGQVNRQTLDELAGDSTDLGNVAAAYTALNSAVTKDNSQRSWFRLNSVPSVMVEAFVKGNLSQSALFSTAGSVTTVTDTAATELGLTVVSVVRDRADSTEIYALVDDFRAKLDLLDETTRLALTGQIASRLESFDDAALHEIVASGPTTITDSAQLILDQRLAANFPDLSIYSNGLLPDDVLCPIPWATNHRLLCAAMDNFERMNVAYKAEFGTDMPILDGYRSFAIQQYVHWNDPNWTAVPGTSNHGWGLGVDFNWDIFKNFDDPEVVWMIENGPKYGWRHPTALGPETSRPEPWHFEFGTTYTGVDSVDFQGPTPEVIYLAKTK